METRPNCDMGTCPNANAVCIIYLFKFVSYECVHIAVIENQLSAGFYNCFKIDIKQSYIIRILFH